MKTDVDDNMQWRRVVHENIKRIAFSNDDDATWCIFLAAAPCSTSSSYTLSWVGILWHLVRIIAWHCLARRTWRHRWQTRARMVTWYEHGVTWEWRHLLTVTSSLNLLLVNLFRLTRAGDRLERMVLNGYHVTMLFVISLYYSFEVARRICNGDGRRRERERARKHAVTGWKTLDVQEFEECHHQRCTRRPFDLLKLNFKGRAVVN